MATTQRTYWIRVATEGAMTLDELSDWLAECRRAGIPGNTVAYTCPGDGLAADFETPADFAGQTAELPVTKVDT